MFSLFFLLYVFMYVSFSLCFTSDIGQMLLALSVCFVCMFLPVSACSSLSLLIYLSLHVCMFSFFCMWCILVFSFFVFNVCMLIIFLYVFFLCIFFNSLYGIPLFDPQFFLNNNACLFIFLVYFANLCVCFIACLIFYIFVYVYLYLFYLHFCVCIF